MTTNRENPQKAKDPARPEGDLYQSPYRGCTLDGYKILKMFKGRKSDLGGAGKTPKMTDFRPLKKG